MTKRLPFIILSIGAVAAGTGIAAYRAFHTPVSPNAVALARQVQVLRLPDIFYDLHAGMSTADVVAIVGNPAGKATNPKFVHKSPAEWQALQNQADELDRKNSDPEVAPNMRLMRINAELEHRAKEIWTYQPSSQVYAMLTFSEDGTLLKVGSGIVRHAPPNQTIHSAARRPAS